MHEAAQSTTGIPIEFLFAGVGAMVAAIYAGIIYEVRALRKSGEKRDLLLMKICSKLNINYPF